MTAKTAEQVWSEYFKGWLMTGQIKAQTLPAMEEYADQFRSKWISVKESPNSTGIYLCCFLFPQEEPRLYTVAYDARLAEWNTENDWAISHWMPLPPPPSPAQ